MKTNTKTARNTGLMLSAAVVAISVVTVPKPAKAQALQPVVDVCTGISLDQSVLTGILNDTVVPTAQGLDTIFDDLLDIAIVGPLLSFSDLDLGLGPTTAALASGDTISLQVLDRDGNVVSPGDCNLVADGYALDNAAGLAIGGNQITGLGDGLAANAGELDAIALGNNASTSVGANGAIALGTDASATAANSVALGAGSLADRGAQTGYTAPGLTGTFDSVGSVSVGSAGNLRQITNVAPGTADSDAATVGQVRGVIAQVDALDYAAVQYDDAARTSVTLAGAGGTTITNLADGAVSATSSDAVNGSQLFATNQNVAINTADIADLMDSTVQYDNATYGTVTLAGPGGTTVTNVAAGTISATSSDAVTGAQLFATNQAIAALGDGSGGSGLAVTYDDASLGKVTLGGGGDGTVVDNVADGRLAANSGEAVNGSQLFATNRRVNRNSQDIDNLDARVTVNEGDIANLDSRVAVSEGDIANLDNRVTVNEGDIADNSRAIANLDTRVTDNSMTLVQVQQRLDNVPVGYVADGDPTMASDTPTDTAAFMGASGGAVRVTNVAAGALSAASTDAVNGAQLAATNRRVADNRADIDTNTSDITTIRNNLAGSTVVAVQYSDPSDPEASNGGTITNDVTFVGADAGQPVRVHNVAAGTRPNDAVNVAQFQNGLADAMAGSMAYTDQQIGLLGDAIGQVRFDLEETRDEAFAGTAGALAVAGLPQVMEPGQSMVGGGIGHYRGQTAFAVGVSSTFNDGKGVVKVGGTVDTNGHGGFNAGAGFAF